MSELSTFILCSRSDNTIEQNQIHFEQNNLSLTVIDNRDKSVMYGRIKGYSESESSYVSFVDDDDVSMLTSAYKDIIIQNYSKPAYTNSVKVSHNNVGLLTDASVRSWSLLTEKTKRTKPHQTMIVSRETALEVSRQAEKIIKYKKWSENSFDYVYRVLISLEIGWTYHPFVTYEWRVGKDSLHLRDRIFLYEASNYFFQHVTGLNLPSYEKDKSSIF